MRELGGERVTEEPGGYQQRVRLNGKIAERGGDRLAVLHLRHDGRADGDPQVMSAIAARLDAALATGQYDALFVADEAKK